MTEFGGKGVMVTGAARGIGLAIARRFLADGASVVLFDLDEDEVRAAAAALGPAATAVAGDVSRRADVRRGVDACLAAAGRIDVCIAHAGIADVRPLLELDDRTWQHVLDVNLTGAFLCTQEAEVTPCIRTPGRPIAPAFKSVSATVCCVASGPPPLRVSAITPLPLDV